MPIHSHPYDDVFHSDYTAYYGVRKISVPGNVGSRSFPAAGLEPKKIHFLNKIPSTHNVHAIGMWER